MEKYIPKFLYPLGCALLVGAGIVFILVFLPLSIQTKSGIPAAAVAIGILLIYIFSTELSDAIGAHLEGEW